MTQTATEATNLGHVAITGVTITPVAFKDPPLLNVVGVHEPYALRAIVEVHTDAGVSGLGETYGDHEPQRLGRFFTALDISAPTPLSGYFERMSVREEQTREGVPAAGFEKVLMPGDLEAGKRQQPTLRHCPEPVNLR
jgi:LDH2 family malate/lactate/ureidoglycolate dehydrogenase